MSAAAVAANASTTSSTLTNFMYPFILSLPPDLTNDLTIYHQLIKRPNYIKLTLNSAESPNQHTTNHSHPHQTDGKLSRKITNRPLSGRSKRSGARFGSYDSRMWACRVDRDVSRLWDIPHVPTSRRPPSRISASAPNRRRGLRRGTKRALLGVAELTANTLLSAVFQILSDSRIRIFIFMHMRLNGASKISNFFL